MILLLISSPNIFVFIVPLLVSYQIHDPTINDIIKVRFVGVLKVKKESGISGKKSMAGYIFFFKLFLVSIKKESSGKSIEESKGTRDLSKIWIGSLLIKWVATTQTYCPM